MKEKYLKLKAAITLYLEAEDAIDPVMPTEEQSQAVMDAYSDLKTVLDGD